MPGRTRLLIAAILLTIASISIAQEPYHSSDPDLLARLSYDYSGVRKPGNARHLCIAVSRDGEYRIVRSSADGQTQRIHGRMPKEALGQLSELLGATDFRSLSGYHGGLIRQAGESFAAEIPLGYRWHADGTSKWVESEAWRLQWLNGDGQSPFPASVSKLTNWLERFQPTDGKSFERGEYPGVCPGEGFRLLQPSVAKNALP